MDPLLPRSQSCDLSRVASDSASSCYATSDSFSASSSEEVTPDENPTGLYATACRYNKLETEENIGSFFREMKEIRSRIRRDDIVLRFDQALIECIVRCVKRRSHADRQEMFRCVEDHLYRLWDKQDVVDNALDIHCLSQQCQVEANDSRLTTTERIELGMRIAGVKVDENGMIIER